MTSPTPVIGLQRQREVLTVALQAGRHVVLEGPPGTGKSTLLRSIAGDLGKAVVFVEGNAELTPARLIGQYDPAQVLADGYLPSSFTDGPLLAAMRAGALLYLEEFNRVPEETLNVLITVLTEGEIAVPRLGLVRADEQFRLIAAMNPFDAIGTARVSQAIADRICRIVLGYQDATAERRITTAVTGREGPVVHFAVDFARATRYHRDVKMGASVRGAIDMVLLIDGLRQMRSEDELSRQTAWDAACAALSGRIRMADGCDRSPESVLRELLDQLMPEPEEEFVPEEPFSLDGGEFRGDDAEPDGRGKADGLRPDAGRRSQQAPRPDAGRRSQQAPRPDAGQPDAGGSRSSLRRDRSRGPSRRSVSRADLAARHEFFRDASPELGALDADIVASLLAADPDAAAMLLADLALATDADLRAAARRLAARIFVQLSVTRRQRVRGVRRMGPGRSEGDLDLERTIDRHAGPWPPAPDQLITRSWHAHRQAVCLLIDASGSMSGLSLAIAAVAASAVVLAADERLDAGVAAFGASTTVLQPVGRRRAPEDLVGELLGLRGHGLTDIAAAFRAAAAQLSDGPAISRRVVLLSDCQRTTGADPANALAGIDRLDVIVPLPAGREPEPGTIAAAQRLARIGGGVSRQVGTLAEVPATLTSVLSAN